MKLKLFQFVASILATSLLVACVPSAAAEPDYRFNRLSVGMSKADAINILGQPETTRAVENTEYLMYHKWMCFNMPSQFHRCVVSYGVDASEKYFVRVIDGKVNAYGEWGDFGSTKDPTTTLNQNIKIQRQ